MQKLIRLQRVRFMPKTLEPGLLYVSEEFGAVAHLCSCGCGAKIRTPIGPLDWQFTDAPDGPSLYPSIGNWQQACRSHYWIRQGKIIPAPDWTEHEVQTGRAIEEKRDRAYYERIHSKRRDVSERLWNWLKNKFN